MARRLFLLIMLLGWIVPANAAVTSLQDVRLHGLQPGMTQVQMRDVLRDATGFKETKNTDGTPWIAEATIQGEIIVAFFASPAKGSKVYRLSMTVPLGKRKMPEIVAAWTEQYGKPSAVRYTDAKRSGQVGWGLKPGAEGSLEHVGANPRRLLGEVETANEIVTLTLLDDSFAD